MRWPIRSQRDETDGLRALEASKPWRLNPACRRRYPRLTPQDPAGFSSGMWTVAIPRVTACRIGSRAGGVSVVDVAAPAEKDGRRRGEAGGRCGGLSRAVEILSAESC
jgi:hypothetical protein